VLTSKANRLEREKSPYLLQHAHNPVDWYPWGEDAFEKAKNEDKPVFLSIGYSTCHWCHVMENESFEDQKIAGILNESYVSIKVDREERPDIDSTYMDVCQMMTGSGGWPLTIIMRPDKKPFFAATYLPKEDRFGMQGLRPLLMEISNIWKTQRRKVNEVAERATSSIADQLAIRDEGGQIDRQIFDSLYSLLRDSFDEKFGGFGPPPKFPLPHKILALLRYWRRTGEQRALDMVEFTLQAMSLGGIRDHVGGGFHRYSTDSNWLVPHFEKMLYDQALLLMAYSEAYQATKRWDFRKTVEDIVSYIERDMTSEEGAFHSAEDADSEGVEGKFYLWTEAEIRETLGKEADLIIDEFNVTEDGNFREPDGSRTGRNILNMSRNFDDISKELSSDKFKLFERVQVSLEKMRNVRENRERPLKDDKMLVDWNGLMIAALAKASRALGSEEYSMAGERAARFILDKMASTGLRHRYREGELSKEVFLQDYSFLIWGLIELYQTTFDIMWFERAVALTNEMLDRFWDDDLGFFLLSPKEGEDMIFKKMESYDGAIPSGNSVAFLDLVMISRMTGDNGVEETAKKLAQTYSTMVIDNPMAFTLFLTGLDMVLEPSSEVVIVGDAISDDVEEMISAIRSEYLPEAIVMIKSDDSLSKIAPFTETMMFRGEQAQAYVCSGRACRAPTISVDEMLISIMRGE
jgi:uncharacterized protein YyaL (SSP411 family)